MSKDDQMHAAKRSAEDAVVDERLATLAKSFPHLANDQMLHSKDVIKDSEALSSKILDGLRQRLAS